MTFCCMGSDRTNVMVVRSLFDGLCNRFQLIGSCLSNCSFVGFAYD